MEYKQECGCIVIVSEDTLSARIEYCSKHKNPDLSLPAEHLTAITRATDHLVKDAKANIRALAEAGSKLIESLRKQ